MAILSKNLLSENLIECIQTDVARLLNLSAPPTVRVVKTLKNPYSETHLLEMTANAIKLRAYVKIPYANNSDRKIAQNRLETEFKIMQELHLQASEAASELRSNVARPIGYYPDHLALATFEAGLETLRQRYRSAGRLIYRQRSRDLLVEEVRNIGLWLRNFQQRTCQATGSFDRAQMTAYVEIRLDLLTKIQYLNFSPLWAKKIVHQIENTSNAIDPAVHRISGRHNDFAGHNILSENGKIWIIDFTMYDTGSAAYDPAYFWLDIEMLKLDPSYCSRFLSRLQEEFLTYYGGISPHDAAFQLVRCQYSLNRVLTLHKPSMFPTLRSVYRRSVVACCMSWVKEFSSKP